MLSVSTKYQICGWLARNLHIKQLNSMHSTHIGPKLKAPSDHTDNQQSRCLTTPKNFKNNDKHESRVG